MRAIAAILESRGGKVTGSDLKTGGHSAENIKDGIDALVYTSAVTENSPGWVEVEEARRRGIKLIKRGEMLAKIVGKNKVIAISGTHGKTTTTAMIGLTLKNAGFDPLIIVGEEVPELSGAVSFGKGKWAVIEACEYDKNFLHLHADIIVVTNVEEEHLDHYPGGLPEIIETFAQFVSQMKSGGKLIYCVDDENASIVAELAKEKNPQIEIIGYGMNQPKDFEQLDFPLAIPGDHNRRNALATLSVAKILGIEKSSVEAAISDFRGAKRRFEIKGEKNGVLVIDDYGHHPTEIVALLAGVKEKYPEKKFTAIFWPHQFRRTKSLLPKFPAAFKIADKVIIKEIFLVPGRDEKLEVSGRDIVNLINQETSGKAEFIDDDNKILAYLRNNLSDKDVLVTVGIPPVYKIAEKFLK